MSTSQIPVVETREWTEGLKDQPASEVQRCGLSCGKFLGKVRLSRTVVKDDHGVIDRGVLVFGFFFFLLLSTGVFGFGMFQSVNVQRPFLRSDACLITVRLDSFKVP